jgi:Tol biopolymer transport system component
LPNNLPPQLTSFVGREREVVDLEKILTGARSLTLTGYSPDGKKVVFMHLDPEKGFRIYKMNADGSGWDHRTFNGNYYGPDWGPRP